ncbi:MAG: ribonuclease HIII [Chlamydiales bacterium]|nr:ribonuclease HIII [Chlamydiales bacterium]
MSDCFVTTIAGSLFQRLKEDLQHQGFTISCPANTVFSAKKTGISISLYQNGKLTVQGKNKKEWIEFYLEPEILQDLSFTHKEAYVDTTPRIGSDEAGKGDFFGPLCVCSLFCDEAGIKQLVQLGVKDSKTLSDNKIIQLAKEIKKIAQFDRICISPRKYNELYEKFNNLNHLLAWAHAKAIENVHLKTNCFKVIVDKFASPLLIETNMKKKSLSLDITQIVKAESDVVVAAASILAREGFVLAMDKLSQDYDMTIPKGASSQVIEAGKLFVKRFGRERLPEVAKMHFKTSTEVLEVL